MTDLNVSKYENAVRTLMAASSPKCFVLTLGCQQNERDSELLRGMAKNMGYSPADSAEDADLIVVNSCAIREHAELRALSLIGSYKAVKAKKESVVIGLCGCMAAEPHIQEKIKKSYPYVSFTLEPNMLGLFPKLLYGAIVENRRVFVLGEDKGEITTEDVPSVRSYVHRAWVSIMYGCNNFCSYCIVPYVRGRERSRAPEKILEECRAAVADGCREITLLGQNVNSYKSNLTFPELLEKVAKIEGDFIIRFMTSHPKDVSDELIAVMKKYTPKIAPFFHLPLQSGSSRILKAMNRTYDREKYLETAEKLKAAVPDIALSTDIIVGFPGETDADFEETLDVVRRVRFDSIFSFIFSPRKGTRAAAMPDETTAEEKNERMEKLLSLSHEIALEKNMPYEGLTVRVLADSDSRDGEGWYLGRTLTNKLVRFQSAQNHIGKFVNVKIEKATPFDLFGITV